MTLVISTTLMLLLAGAPGYARQEPEKEKPAPQQEPKKQEEPKKDRQKQDKPQEKPRPQEPDRQQQDRDRAKQDKPAQQRDHAQPEDRTRSPQPKPSQQQDRAQQQQHGQPADQRSTDQRNVRRVPEERYRANFGREHRFHVERRDDRRFQYSGFWFQYNDPWPGDWDYNDDVYIEDIDGEYYMYNPRHPGVHILVIVAE